MSRHGCTSECELSADVSDLQQALDAVSSPVDGTCTKHMVDGAAGAAVSPGPENDLWSCAICLDDIDFADLAVVKGCEHTYCVHCILKWASLKDDAHCPTCKKPFSNLFVHRQLDGALTDFQIEESAVLLARSDWFQRWLKEHEQVRDMYKYSAFRSVSAAATGLSPEALRQQEWAEDAMCDFFDGEFEDDEEIEEYYLSRAGTSRVTFGNRRWGANGYVKSGHRRAQPVQPKVPKNTKKGGSSCANAASNSASARSCGSGCTNDGASQSGGAGRRARRKARQAAVAGFD